jgi:hypothetical protein
MRVHLWPSLIPSLKRIPVLCIIPDRKMNASLTEDREMAEVACGREGVQVIDGLLARGDGMKWAGEFDDDKEIMRCKMIHNLAEKSARTRFIVAQIEQDFGMKVSVEDIEDLKDRFVDMYHITVRERA